MDVQRRSATTKGPAEWFTGDVYVDPIAHTHGPASATLASVRPDDAMEPDDVSAAGRP